ncbi:Zinc finger protein 713 [Amphibalanus amphitrite]|uniref:Zinc finger protein 713 n=1 Tax=Amphibalanus amphitrite TaxID=1232801 RepID=A0A6A4X8J4_AMPAM|nr:Zinc finger protein 713 [Amphibalanus amphitrite]
MFSRGDSEQERLPEEGEAAAAAAAAGMASAAGGLGAVARDPLMRSPRALGADVFRFDSGDSERFACRAISEEDEDVFSPVSSKSPHSSLDSPLVSQDSPRVSGFGTFRIKEEPDVDPESRLEGAPAVCSPPRLHVLTCERPTVCAASTAGGAHKFTFCACAHCTAGMESEHRLEVHSRLLGAGLSSSPISPLTPLTPASPASLSQSPLPLEYLSQLSELYRRRSRSESDLSAWMEPPAPAPARGSVLRPGRAAAPQPLFIPGKSGSLESDQSSPQDSPLDLSVRSARLGSTASSAGSETGAPPRFGAHHPLLRMRSPGLHPPIPIVHGNVASPTTRDSVALRYNLEVCPVVEQMPPGADVAYVCPVCGQMFSLHDRLAKHMASRHKTKPADASSKAYMCETCKRSFARSDMLTRHMRLHTGLKPYTCRVCGQVFSRSDHLSTHQRTHTGEKPYKCPQCPYAACRRDMITRHMRTHSRYELAEGGGSVDEAGPPRSPRAPPRRANSEEQPPTYLRHLSAGLGGLPAPPSPSAGLGGLPAPPSPSAALQSLSVQSPAPMETGEPPDD